MLTLQHLRSLIGNQVGDIANPNKEVIESDAGYDGIIELIQNKSMPRTVILEHNEIGELSFRTGGFMLASQSLWVMEMVAANESRLEVQQRCWNRAKRIIAILAHAKDEEDFEVGQLDWSSIPYGVRNAGPSYTGYEFTLRFTEDYELSFFRNMEVEDDGQQG